MKTCDSGFNHRRFRSPEHKRMNWSNCELNGIHFRQNALHQHPQFLLGFIRHGDDVRQVDRLEGVGQAHVGDDREAQYCAAWRGRRRSPPARWTCRRRRRRCRAGSGTRPAFPGSARRPPRRRPYGQTIFSSRAIALGQVDAGRVVGAAHIGEAVPRRSSLGPISGLSPIRLMWSSMTMMSPLANCGFMPPQALLTISVSQPRAFITRTGKVTCWSV